MFIFRLLMVSFLILPGFASGDILKTVDNGFDSTGFSILGVGGGASYGAFTQDDHFYRTYGGNQTLSLDQTRPGDLWGTGIPGITIALSQLVFDRPNGWAHSETLVLTFLTTSILKVANNRQRPNGLNRHSMPSGHSSTSFATATHLAAAYGWVAGVPAFAMAMYTAATRVADDAHWFSDTMVGATIGVFWGRAAMVQRGNGSLGQWVPMTLPDGGLGVGWVGSF